MLLQVGYGRHVGLLKAATQRFVQSHQAGLRGRLEIGADDYICKPFSLLELVARPGRVMSRHALMDHLYTDHRIVEDRTIDSHVKKIRRKFEGIVEGMEIIQSVYGAGYKFMP